MITKEIREQWANALESGAYKQGIGALLHLNGTYCCLGVLCAELDLPTDEATGYDALGVIGLNGEDRAYFTVANDDLGKSFVEIAEMVRALPTSD